MYPKHVHIIGIAGKTSSAIAKLFKDLGCVVTGSDQGMYPPVSDFLAQNGISVTSPYSADNLAPNVDLVIVAGNALVVNPDNPEYLEALDRKIEVLNYPEVLQRYVVKPNSIVVMGNFGKGTVSGALVKALTDLKQNPSYMVGGQLIDFEDSLKVTDGVWSVLEGDEYPAPPLLNKPAKSKFFYYQPKYAVLTSAEWDHYDIFSSEREYVENYQRIIQQLPADGLLVANLDGRNVTELIKQAPCRVITYSMANTQANYSAKTSNLDPTLFGEFNLSNLTAAYALLSELNFDQTELQKSLNSYRGLVYRLQTIWEADDLVLIRDLAHSPVKAQAALKAVRTKWPHHHVVAVFEIFSSSLKNKKVLQELPHRFDAANEVIIPKVDMVARIDKADQVTGKEITNTIGQQARYMPKDEYLLKYLKSVTKPAVIVFMSSGGLRQLPEKLMAEVS